MIFKWWPCNTTNKAIILAIKHQFIKSHVGMSLIHALYAMKAAIQEGCLLRIQAKPRTNCIHSNRLLKQYTKAPALLLLIILLIIRIGY